MSTAIEIRKTDDGAILARRLDGKPLTPADKEEARRLAVNESNQPAIEQIVDEAVIAVLIDSTVLGAPIWFAFRDDWRPAEGDATPVFYASELPALCGKSAEQLRAIFTGKDIFGGGLVRK